jgi:hypothetical protein
MDELDAEEQYDEWRREYANRLFACSQAIQQMALFAPEGANPDWYASRSGWFHKEANEVWPDENSWPKSKENKAEIWDLRTRMKVNT